jgi:hypothetical protein
VCLEKGADLPGLDVRGVGSLALSSLDYDAR